MRLDEIAEVYREMGLGTQAERDAFLKWAPQTQEGPTRATFFIETPNSDLKESQEKSGAELA